jgi:predicted TIM-barrel fold metal-dependent hydrolase
MENEIKMEYFDSHCHLFNLGYALKEVKGIFIKKVNEFFSLQGETNENMSFTQQTNWIYSDIKDALVRFYELVNAAQQNEQENFDFLTSKATTAFDRNFNVVPLMMDIYYMFDDTLYADQLYEKKAVRKSFISNQQAVQNEWNRLLDDFENFVKQSNEKNIPPEKVTETIELIQDVRNLDFVNHFVPFKTDDLPENVEYSEGFANHLKSLLDLAESNKGVVYPFLAVDPRREGMIEAILEGKFFTGNRKFHGIKLYPRLGYHPQCKPLLRLYEYCNNNHIPITVHCSQGGFPLNADDEKREFCNPLNFKEILKNNKNLNLNLAHFGNSEKDKKWSECILCMMKDYENLFTDLSCYTGKKELNYAKEMFDKNKQLKDRLLFGTDYAMLYFTGNTTIDKYFKNFNNIFKDDLESMMHNNPKKFLGLELNC